MAYVTLQNAIDNSKLAWLKASTTRFRVVPNKKILKAALYAKLADLDLLSLAGIYKKVPQITGPEWRMTATGAASGGLHQTKAGYEFITYVQLAAVVPKLDLEKKADLFIAAVTQYGDWAWLEKFEELAKKAPKAVLAHPRVLKLQKSAKLSSRKEG